MSVSLQLPRRVVSHPPLPSPSRVDVLRRAARHQAPPSAWPKEPARLYNQRRGVVIREEKMLHEKEKRRDNESFKKIIYRLKEKRV